MTDPSAYDKERIAHINYLMENIHDSTNEIYESLIDRDFKSLKQEIKTLQSLLKDISISVEDDI
jgi:mevalonate kinase|tara:strand:+ start:3550 stop:3741 length:192 start_codon:yes stop_codon:yes gene_type:complete